MPISNEFVLLDTNVLVAAFFQEHEHHAVARALLDRVHAGELSACVVPQILAEFFAVVTDSRRVTSPRKPDKALEAIEKLLSISGMNILPVPVDVVPRWIILVRQNPATRGAIFDHQLAATMLGNGVHRIYTFNRNDFEKFHQLEVLMP